MTTITGEVTEHKTVSSALTVRGSVSGGVTVKDGGNLVVKGRLTGPVVVESGGMVNVQGLIDGDVILRGGVILAAGTWLADLVEPDGDVGFAVGSCVGDRALQADGSWQEVECPTTDFYLDTDAYRFLTPDGRFVCVEDYGRLKKGDDELATRLTPKNFD